MAIVVSCPSCGAQYNVKDELAGRKAVCKKCNSQMQIPAGSAATSEPRATSKSADENSAAGGVGQSTPSNCPMCGTGVLPGADSCMVCGHSFGGGGTDGDATGNAPAWAATAGGDEEEDYGYESPEEAEERRIAELLAPVEESLVRRIANWTVKIVLVVIAVGVVGYAGWSLKQLISRVNSHGRIGALVESGLDPKARLPELANSLAGEIPHVATYGVDLAAQAESASQRNLDVTGLKYVEEPDAEYYVVYKRKPMDPRSKLADEVPEAWRKAAVFATLLAHLPEDCDIDPLVEVQDPIALPPVKQLFLDRKDLDWQISASCDEDEQKRDFAAGLLIEQLNTSPGDAQATRASLAKMTTPVEKRKIFNDLQAKLGKRGAEQP